MRIAFGLLALVSVLGLVSAVVQARRGRWLKAAETVLPVLGADLLLLGGAQAKVTAFLWLGGLLILAGFAVECLSFWRTRAAEQRQQQAAG
ncbi:hypothetical protein ACIRBZ_11230 [Streptomyces sp. NPDC094038]|uniref:hypothetical protein n=1 Tax=Streptomyces sp. NPDC094038 TaxID=3366055 RepID=UPI003808CB1D